MRIKTRLTELLGIRLPIVEGGMQWVGRAELAAAVSNAGALSMVTARTQATPEDLLHEIERTRALTDQPFGINLTLSSAHQSVSYEGWLDAIIASGVRIVETAANDPRRILPRLKAAGITVIHKCTSVRHARAAERAGVDVISIDSFEAAGHCGEDDVGSMVMIPSVVRAVGVNIGTRFMLTRECAIHDGIKQALLAGSERDTVLIKRTLGHTARYFRNPVADEVLAMVRRHPRLRNAGRAHGRRLPPGLRRRPRALCLKETPDARRNA
jgi:nitronate monooxygenase